MPGRINPNSSIRSGYAYEDLYVLKLCVDWLRYPDLYQEIRIQYVPLEIEESKFAIDDIVVIDKDNNHTFYQLKHLQNPLTDPWTFDKLLAKGLQRWIGSFDQLNKSQISGIGYLITNGSPAQEIKDCMKDDKIDFTALKNSYPAFLATLIQIHGEPLTSRFFSEFVFEFDQPGKPELNKHLRDILYYELKVTESGVNRLLLHIVTQGSEKYPLNFKLTDIRAQLSWDNPRPLNQDFNVPVDFEFFNKVQHTDVVRDIRNNEGGIKVFTGKPGSGKSTYLSKLYQILTEKLGVFAIRHHYHLNPKDTSYSERLNANRVKEALKAEFKKQKEDVLGRIGIENTEHTPLKEFIGQVSKFYAAQGKTFVLIIDGLDHVIRESRDVRELSEFIEQVLYPQEGYWLLLGTQETAIPYLPNTVTRYAPSEKWIEIKGLNRKAVEKIFIKHPSRLLLAQTENFRGKVLPLLFSKTQGNPLHLKYVLGQLVVNNDRISIETIQRILPYKDEINSYYSELWAQLSSLAQTFTLAVTCLDFKLQEEHLFDLASGFTSKPHEISDAYKQIKHLIRIELHGVSIYHNSFGVFIGNQPELAQQKVLLYKQIKNWLKKPKNRDLAWAELIKIEYYLGNDKPVMKVDKDWIINSYLDCRDESQIVKILKIGTEAAFLRARYDRVSDFRMLEVYFENKTYNLHKVLPKIWSLAYNNSVQGLKKYLDYENLNHYQIKDYLINLYDHGKIQLIPEEALQRFNDLLADRDNEQQDVVESLLEILAHFTSEPFKRVHKFIIQYRQNQGSGQYFDIYLKNLFKRGQNEKAGQLLKSSLDQNEKQIILQRLFLNELLNHDKTWHKEIKKFSLKAKITHLHQLYFYLREQTLPNSLELSPFDSFPNKLDYHSIRSANIDELYEDNFLTGLFLCLSGSKKAVEDWTSQQSDQWQIMLMKKFLEIAINMADSHQQKSGFQPSSLLKSFQSLPDLDFYADHDIYELKRTIIPLLFKTIIRTGAILNAQQRISNSFLPDDIKELFQCKWINKDSLNEILQSNYFKFSDASYEAYKEIAIDELKKTVIHFNDRAEQYIHLTSEAKNLNKRNEVTLFLRKAAENLISYGNHKDMSLDYVLQSIKCCGEAGSNKTQGFLRQIAPYVYHIESYTDGDAIGTIPYDWGGLLGDYDPNLLFNFYFDALSKRDYGLSESLFADVLGCLNLEDPIGTAIGNTAITHSPFNGLSYLSKENPAARKIMGNIKEVFGAVDYSDEDHKETEQDHQEKGIEREKFTQVKPADLVSYYNNLDFDGYSARRYAQHNFLKDWCRVWLTDENNSLPEIIGALKEIYTGNFESADDETLDFIYPFAAKVDKEFAFQCLCWSYANNGDWSPPYITSLESAKKKWAILLSDFPERRDEFFDSTIFNSGRYYGRDGGYFMPIPKVIQFFIFTGSLAKAEEITQFNIDFLPNLFPDVILATPPFIKSEIRIEPFEILLKRMEWLSPLARERAAFYLSELLIKDESGVIHTEFLKWLASVQLISHACYGFLIILKSLERTGSFTAKHLKFNVTYPIGFRCMVTDLFLMAIAKKSGQRFYANMPLVLTISSRKDEMTEEKFFENMGNYIATVYQDYINQMQKNSHLKIWRVWYYLFIEKIEVLGLKESFDDRTYNNRKNDITTGRSPLISEVFKSTFFSLLDYLYDAKLIDTADLEYYTKKNLPVDISLWDIQLTKAPDWWPRFSKIESKGKLDLAHILQKPVNDLVKAREQKQLLYLCGAIQSDGQYFHSTRQGEIQIVPFAYKIAGKDIPGPESIFRALQANQGVWYSGAKDIEDFGFFNNEIQFINRNKADTQKLKDLEITNLVARINLDVIHMWQYYRMMFEPVLLTPNFTGSLILNTDNRFIEYKERDCLICSYFDFTFGLRDQIHIGDILPSGNYININKDYLDSFLNKRQLKLGYVYKMRVKNKEHTYSDRITEECIYNTIDILIPDNQ